MIKNRTCSTIKREYYSQKKKSHHRRHHQQPSAISSSRQCRQQNLCFSFLFFENKNDVSSRTSHQPPPPANDIDQLPHDDKATAYSISTFLPRETTPKQTCSMYIIVYAATDNTFSQQKSTPTSCKQPLSLSSIITSSSIDS